MNEEILVVNEYKYVSVFLDSVFQTKFLTNYFVVRDNLTNRQFYATLEGHMIYDSGLINKIKRLSYEINNNP